MPEFGRALRQRFRLEPGVDFLNHGSFGAAPLEVLDAAERWRRRMEANPDDFYRDVLPGELRRSASRLAPFVGARAQDLVFVENATAGMNAVLRSLSFQPADEILLTSLSYGAVRKLAHYVCDRSGARCVEPRIPIPVHDNDELLQSLTRAFSARTRLLIVDHIASPTGLIWPLTELVALARSHGVPVLVDGAHAPGQIELDIPSLGADWYTGNCHKWLFAARGCGFLWTRPERNAAIHPIAISHGYGGGLTAEFDWTGTRDFSAWLAIEAALEFVEAIGAERVRSYCHDLVTSASAEIARLWREPLAGPPTMHGSMMAIRLPNAWQRVLPATREAAAKLQSTFMREHRIAVAINVIDDTLWARISAQIYNAPEDYERLGQIGPRGPG
jgi:isopenicillin-N epimerase